MISNMVRIVGSKGSSNGDGRYSTQRIDGKKGEDGESDESGSSSSASSSASTDSTLSLSLRQTNDAAKPSTPIAIASLIVPSAEPIKPSKEYINISTLFVEPQRVTFTTDGGRSSHILINESNVRLAIKVRSSNNKVYRVWPVFSYLDSGTMNELEVLRLPGGDAGVDQLMLCYVTAKDDRSDIRELFKASIKQDWIGITMTTKQGST